MSNRRLQTLVALMLAGAWGAGVWIGHSNGYLRALDRVESTLTDLRTLARGIKAPPDMVTIVAIDDDMVKDGSPYPLARTDLASIVDAIARLKPKVIAVDLLLLDRGSADGDAAVAKSFATHPPVLAAAAIFSEGSQPVTTGDDGPLVRLPKADRFLLPLQMFADHAEVGIANVATTESGTPFAVPMLFRTHDRIELSLALRVAASAIGKPLTIEPNQLKFGEDSVSTDTDYTLPISYYGPRRTIRTVSAASAIGGTLDSGIIADRVVILGATVTGGGDFFPTPFDSRMPGVEVLATAIT